MQRRSGSLYPPLKWAGGKRWLLQSHAELFPAKFNNYIEPFCGGAAVFFWLSTPRGVLADTNSELINFYEVLRDTPQDLLTKLRVHSRRHSNDYYYEVRSSKPTSASGRAARFLYLNRTCWNGLYRENAKGEFNVPIGTKSDVLMDTSMFEKWSEALAGCSLFEQDFEKTLALAMQGDFVFVDPPYTVAHNNNGFIKYNQKLFSWADQVRLATAVEGAVGRGAYVLVTNASHDSVRELYRQYVQHRVSRASVLAGKREARAKYEEVVVQCY